MTITRLLNIIGSFSQRFYVYLRWLISYWRPRSEIGQSSRRSATDMEQQQIFKVKYPTWTKNLSRFGNKEMYCALAKFLVLIIEHTEGLFKSATERLPNFPILGLLWKGVSSWRWQILEVNVWKNIPKPSRSISWADGHDMLLSNKGCVWYITHGKRRSSPDDLRCHNVKISAWLFPKHNLGKH